MQLALYLKHFPAGGPVNDGTSLAVAGLASGLAENGARVTVLCEGETRCSAQRDGYTVESFVHTGRGRRFTLAPALKAFIAEQLAPSRGLCILNGMFHPSVYALGRWLRRLRVPYVMAPHDPYDPAVFRSNAHLKWPYWFLFERRLLGSASAVQVLAPGHAANLRRLGVRTPIIQTDNGVAAERVPAESSLQWRAAGEPARLVFLGRLDAYNKGLDLLIDAFARLRGRHDAQLTLQGPDWGDRAALDRQARRAGLDGALRILAPDYQRSSPEILGDHDVFCLPSRFEGFGLAALEAMLAGRVLLVSENAGIARHVVASGCGVAVPSTVDGVAAGLCTLLRRRDRWRSMGLAGRHHALATLRWDRISAGLLSKYEGLRA
jgi:glycosyltransferase involved in cell wall biosynthesis